MEVDEQKEIILDVEDKIGDTIAELRQGTIGRCDKFTRSYGKHAAPNFIYQRPSAWNQKWIRFDARHG